MNIFEEAIKILKNKNKIRQLVAGLHSEDVKKIIGRIEAVYLEVLEAEQARKAEQAGKVQALSEVMGKLKELGLSIDDIQSGLLSGAAKPKRQYKTREKFTFAYETAEGEQKTWHGGTVGRKPGDLAHYLERTGKALQDCIVSE